MFTLHSRIPKIFYLSKTTKMTTIFKLSTVNAVEMDRNRYHVSKDEMDELKRDLRRSNADGGELEIPPLKINEMKRFDYYKMAYRCNADFSTEITSILKHE